MPPERVILVGTLAPWNEPKGAGDQIWCINRAYLHQPNLDRLYLMDPLPAYFKAWGGGFVEEINALGVPIMLRWPNDDIPNGVQYKWKWAGDDFGIEVFGSSMANAIAHAIVEGIAELVLHRMYLKGQSEAYLHHKHLMDLSVREAIAHGVRVYVDPDSFLTTAGGL